MRPVFLTRYRLLQPLLLSLLLAVILAAPCAAALPHPRIWVTPAERDAILAKIDTQPYAAALFAQLKARADDAVARHKANPQAFLSALPLASPASPGQHPPFRTITADEADRYVLMPYLQDAIDCGVLFFLTEDSAYAQCAADITGVFVSALAQMQRSPNLGNGGLVYPNDHLKEARIIGAQVPVAFDFIASFVKDGNAVFDLTTGGQRPFPFADAQHCFQTYVDMAIEVGHTGSNWSVLESGSLLHNLLCFDSEAKIRAFLPFYLSRQSERQDPLSTIAKQYPNPGDIWPESLQYSRHVASFSIYLMLLLDRLFPDLNLARAYPNILEAPSKDFLLQYPNGEFIFFGDGHRHYRTDYPTFEMAYALAQRAGFDHLTSLYGALLQSGFATDYDRAALAPHSFAATVYKAPLKLLWSVPNLQGNPIQQSRPRSVDLPFAGIFIQRNPSPINPVRNGLMAFIGGGHYVHGHASGMNIELYALGHVLGVDAGKGAYRSDIHENYYRLFAAHNTVISNGASASRGGWVNLGIEQLSLRAMEPMPGKQAVSPLHSFSTTRFFDRHNRVAPAEHERTLAVIRTSPTTGFFVDVFRARSDSPDQFHDYLYHNIGESLTFTRAPKGFALAPTPERFQANANAPWKQNGQFRHPGWHFFDAVESAPATSEPLTARFSTAKLEPYPLFMDVFINGGTPREVSRAMAPPSVSGRRLLEPITPNAPPYDERPTPTLVLRQYGQAWNQPFVLLFAPTQQADDGSSMSHILNVDYLSADDAFCGLVVDSVADGQPIRQFILILESPASHFHSSDLGITFTGHFAVITTATNGTLQSLYIGNGRSLQFQNTTLTTPPNDNAAFLQIQPE